MACSNKVNNLLGLLAKRKRENSPDEPQKLSLEDEKKAEELEALIQKLKRKKIQDKKSKVS